MAVRPYVNKGLFLKKIKLDTQRIWNNVKYKAIPVGLL